MPRKPTIILSILILCINSLFGDYIYYKFNISDQIQPIDLQIDANGFIQIVAKTGIYQLNHQQWQKVADLNKKVYSSRRHEHEKVYNRTNRHLTSDFTLLNPSNDSKLHISPLINESSVYKGSIIIGSKTFSLTDKKLKTLNIDLSSNAYYRTGQLKNTRFISIYGDGLYKIDSLNNIHKEINEYDVCSFQAKDSLIYLGLKGQLLKIDTSGQIQNINLDSLISDQPILDLAFDRKNYLHLITPSSYIRFNQGHWKKVNFPLSNDDEVISIKIDQHNNVWVLCSKQLLYYPDLDIKEISTIQSEVSSNSIYHIRGNSYISDGKSVFQIKEDTLIEKTIPPPLRVIPKANTTILVFNNRFLNINTSTGKVVSQNKIQVNEQIVDIIPELHLTCTKRYLYKSNSRLNAHPETFFKIIQNESNVYALSTSKIYSFQNSELLELGQSSITPSKNAFFYNDKIIYTNQNLICQFDTKTRTQSRMPLGNGKLLDLLELKNEIAILTSKSIVFLDKKKSLQNVLEITRVIPIFQKIDEGKLFQLDENFIYLSLANKILKINISSESQIPLPNFEAEIIERRDSSFLSFKSTNYWTDNINYTYYGHNKSQERTTWTSQPINYLKDPSKSKFMAKMKDDIFMQNIFVDIKQSSLNEDKSIIKHLYWYLLGFLLYTLVLLCIRNRTKSLEN